MPSTGLPNLNTQDYWEGVYRDRLYPTLDRNNRWRYQAAASLQVGETALDIGCGEAGLGFVLLSRYSELFYVGVDFSAFGLRQHVLPARWWGRYSLIEDDWRKPEWKVSYGFDTVYLCEVLEHCENPELLLKRAAARAKQRIVVTVPQFGVLSEDQTRGEHLWDFTEEELYALLGKYGEVAPVLPVNELCWVTFVDREEP